MLIQILAYSYLFTTITLSNHTFPNAWYTEYPSFKSSPEGRWFADLIIFFQGGSGVQSLQLLFSSTIQSINGIIFARLMGVQQRLYVFLLAAVLCLYPAFLDYYSFYIDGITFVLGDTFVLLGLIVYYNQQVFFRRIAMMALFFLLAIASYQPKVSLVCFLALAALLLRFSQPKCGGASGANDWISVLQEITAMALAVGISIGFYWLTAKLLVNFDKDARTHINTFKEAIEQMCFCYTRIYTFYMKGNIGLPQWLHLLPTLSVVFGTAAILKSMWKNNARAIPFALFILGVLPIALYLPYVINNETWQHAGRILSAQGYCLVFFIGCGMRERIFKDASIIIASVFFYFFMVLSTQENSAIAFKTIYDFNNINLLITRVESVLGTLNPTPYALVIVGHFPTFNYSQYIRSPAEAIQAQIFTQTFETYRQTEILNFFLGKEVFRRPTIKEEELAIHSIQGKMPWPSEQSVYIEDNTLVILLEKYAPGISITWAE